MQSTVPWKRFQEGRVRFSMLCTKNAYNKIETQVVDNTGIRDESSRRYGVDQSSQASNFEPDKLLEYIRDLAPGASFGADRLDLVIAQAQLSAFCRFKGYRLPTEFPSAGELLENDAETEQVSDEMIASHKHKHTPKDGPQSRKERSLTELMGEREYSPEAEDADDLGKSVSMSSGNKRKAVDPLGDGSDKRGPSLVKGNSDESVIDGSPKIYEHSDRRSVVSQNHFRIVQNYSEEQLLHNTQNGAGNLQLVPFGAEKSVKPEINLNKMFRRFGPLMESETEVDHDSGRAKVIFKRGSDAEVARNSAEKFNISVLVNYQIGYSPLISVKILPLTIPQSQEDVTSLL
ncbi:UNVERIFIED_CONTAM: hypothetical protein Sradi_6172800 [Sesamum radiatum]|uniref:RRM domain-containing protein n=1 Tax=Sesamum radiatum TaxID=300843 RepID=A0AAW2K8C6_SESRA